MGSYMPKAGPISTAEQQAERLIKLDSNENPFGPVAPSYRSDAVGAGGSQFLPG